MRFHALFLAVLLAVPAEGLPDKGFPDEGRGADLLRSWGRCDPLNRCQAACKRREELTCSSRLSDGPTDADVEIQLANLPASTASQNVQLHWWAPRKSPTDYHPLKGLVNCSIYHNMKVAYPSIDDSDFNGGNVRVSESGAATIRVRAPSTFFVWRYVAIPHINMRLCKGSSSFKHKLPDAVFYFGSNETWLKQRSSTTARIEVVSAVPYAARVPSTTEARGPRPVAVVVAASVLPPSNPPTTTTTAMTETVAQVLIDAAKDALSLDALEFSPVYECFLLDQFFDHFSSDCKERCPSGSEVAHGQCARPATEAAHAELSATWKLTIICRPGLNCWEKENTTLHRARLAAASHLMIPFQEVKVTVGYDWPGSSRRLLAPLATQDLYLTVYAKTQRWTQGKGNRQLSGFFSVPKVASEVLDARVAQSQIHSGNGIFPNKTTMSELNDPYSPAYEALKPTPKPSGTTILGVLPPAAIAGIACGAVAFLISVIVAIICYRRRQQKRAREAVAQGKTANFNINKVLESKKALEVTDSENPVMI